MTATFCNVPTAPNTAGYGAASTSSGASPSSAGTPISSVPACAEEPPANELCN